MAKRRTIFAILILAVTGVCGAPIAAAGQRDAVLRQVHGSVLLNHATGYSSASANMALHAGDRVFTMGNSRATIVWSDGCIAQLEENSIFTYQKLSPCRGGADTRKKVGAIYARAIGSDIVTEVPPKEQPPATPSEPMPTQPPPAPQSSTPAPPEVMAADTTAAGGTTGGFTGTQLVVTGIAVGSGLAVVVQASSNDSGNGAVSPE